MGKPINILFLCTPSSIHDLKWMRYFAESPEKYSVFCLTEGDETHTEKLRSDLHKLNIYLLPAIHPFSIKSPLNTIRSIHKIRKYIKEYHIDILHVLFATPYSLWVNYVNGPAIIITTRGSDVLKVIPELSNHKGLRGIYFKWLFKQFQNAFNKATYITSTSQAQIDTIKKLLTDRSIHLIRTGVDVELICTVDTINNLPEPVRGRKIIFSPRFFSEIYNIHYQLEAIEKLPKAIIELYSFVFIKGKHFSPSYALNLQNTLHRLNIEIGLNYVVFDFLNQEEIWSLFHFAEIAIMTPVSDGTPNSAFEAMAAKCPLIMSDIEMYENHLFNYESVHKVALDNSDELSKIILNVLNSDNTSMTENAYEIVSKFGNRNIEMRKLEQLYFQISK